MTASRRNWKILASLIGVMACALVILSSLPAFPDPGAGPIWNGLTLGVSTPAEAIEKLGEPREVREFPALKFYNYRRVRLRFAWNRLVLVEADISGLQEDSPEKGLSYYLALYGEPDYVSWTSEIRAGAGYRTLAFLDDGVLVIATATNDPIDAFVRNAAYFQPCPLECAKQRAPLYFRDIPPNPHFGSLPASELTQDPWGFTLP
jgi:hypothetical protein